MNDVRFEFGVVQSFEKWAVLQERIHVSRKCLLRFNAQPDRRILSDGIECSTKYCHYCQKPEGTQFDESFCERAKADQFENEESPEALRLRAEKMAAHHKIVEAAIAERERDERLLARIKQKGLPKTPFHDLPVGSYLYIPPENYAGRGWSPDETPRFEKLAVVREVTSSAFLIEGYNETGDCLFPIPRIEKESEWRRVGRHGTFQDLLVILYDIPFEEQLDVLEKLKEERAKVQ